MRRFACHFESFKVSKCHKFQSFKCSKFQRLKVSKFQTNNHVGESDKELFQNLDLTHCESLDQSLSLSPTAYNNSKALGTI